MTKKCSKCGQVKLLLEFYKDRTVKDGYKFLCKECYKRYYQNNKKKILRRTRKYDKQKRTNPEFVAKEKKYYKKWYKKNGRKRATNYAEITRKWYYNHLKEAKTKYIVKKAVKNGVITKPNKCEECGSKTRLNAHHPDYGKPLEVIWLCQSCHKKLHTKNPLPLLTV